MSADAYLQQILNREAVDTGIFSPVRAMQATLEPAIRLWANRFLIGVTPSGSFAKGTANKSGTDIDLFISLSSETGETLKEIYESLFTRMQEIGYAPRHRPTHPHPLLLGGRDLVADTLGRDLTFELGKGEHGRLLGHNKVETTAKYAHLVRDVERAAAARTGDSIGAQLMPAGAEAA